jgi:single-stranded-DNA-specific exonuclease
MTHWLDPQPVDPSPIDELGLNTLVAETLIRRGFTNPVSARAFLDPLYTQTLPASILPGIDKALECITRVLRNREPICVWGDFDVDGQTATTILVQTLLSVGANVTYHIPIRAKESHGVNLKNIAPIIDNGIKLIITCDTGISALEEADYARLHGAEIVITDHHDLPDQLPEATAIVNPKFLPPDHPLANLPGVGVAYKLAEALIGSEGSGIDGSHNAGHLTPNSLQDLAFLGIIADLALLKGETRYLAQKGIQALRNTDRLGLKTIAQLAGLDLSQATEESIGFNLGPRMNALGRLSDANPAVELLLTYNPVRARVLAAQIEGLNTQRRLLTDQVYQAAEAQLHADPSLLTQPLILLTHPSWPGGVIGIVASRLVGRYHKPTILLTAWDDGTLHGSARSVEGLNITGAIATNKNYLLGYGGHPMAAGFSLLRDNLPDFSRALNKTLEKMFGEIVSEEPTLQVDAWLELSSLTLDLANSLEGLAPFGPGNPALVFATHDLNLLSESVIGRTQDHRRLIITDEHSTKKEFLWWNSSSKENPESPMNAGKKFDLAYRLRANTYRGERRLSLELVDFRITEQKPAEIGKPEREIHDLRLQPASFKLSSSTLIWAEGQEKSKGKNRFELYQADEFAIWTAPPSPVELRSALETVKPKIIYLFAVAPNRDPSINASGGKTDEFLSHLAGLAKYALNHREGQVKISELAAATAHREVTIRLGLEWLAAGGHLLLEGKEDELHLVNGDGIANPYLQSELFIAVRGLLEETYAYRAHIARAEAHSIFKL